MEETTTPSLQGKGRRARTEFDESLSVRLIFLLEGRGRRLFH